MRNIIFDFDGTLTDIEKSTLNWQKRYPEVCADFLKVDYNLIEEEYNNFKESLKDHAERGFVIAGCDSLPANSDPYVRSQKAIQDLIDAIRKKELSVPCEIPEDETKFLIDVYAETNRSSKDKKYFREGAQSLLKKVRDNYNVAIVTNSGEEKVKTALKDISISDIPVFGNARKLFVDNSIESSNSFEYNERFFKSNLENTGIIPRSITFSDGKGGNSPRKVCLRRKNYLSILETLANQGFLPGNTTVVGDIFELDLALPLFLGYSIIQIDNGSVPEYEKNYMEKEHFFVNNLKELEEVLKL